MKKTFTPKKRSPEEHEIKENTTNPENGYYVKAEREKQFSYSCHTSCDRNKFVLGLILTPRNVYDSNVFPSLLESVIQHFKKPFAVVADSAYKTVPIAHHLLNLPAFPYTRPRGVKEMFKTKDFYSDDYYDFYLCENNEVLRY